VGLGRACGLQDNSAAASDPPRTAAPHLAGVYPEQWRATASPASRRLGRLLGGTAKQLDSALAVPHGLPHPCGYEIDAGARVLDVRRRLPRRHEQRARCSRSTATTRAGRRATRIDAGVGKPGDAGVAPPTGGPGRGRQRVSITTARTDLHR
jgi:hypothetical protein